ncbi:hypothetical protein [uncultured Gemmiger sp.]|uniref:hypothetical protein n=1 Tax=uncultured Gemmiger sp. TaxID=1623490 RepID=UPI0026001AFD|nr:hypothetical protein [uncultured Gemmiger sp.]
MLTGKTKSGFVYCIPESRLDNMELLDALVGIDKGDGTQLPRAVDLLLGSEMKQKLYDHLRTEQGNVPVKETAAELLEIMQGGQRAKNS